MRIPLNIRYASYLLTALVAGFIVVVSQGFAPTTAGWIAFGAGIFFIATSTLRLLSPGVVHRVLHLSIETLGILMVIETLIASGSTVTWLSFAGALAVVALALIGLTLHELSAERVVHSLEVSRAKSNARQPVLS